MMGDPFEDEIGVPLGLGLQPEIFRITASKLFGVPFVCVIPN